MKKSYNSPTLKVVKIQPAQFIAASTPVLRGKTDATEGNLGREARFSEWEEE